MNTDVKRQWVEALRSGTYQQGTGVLYSPADSRYCCLGVLCDLYAKSHPGIEWTPVEADRAKMLNEDGVLPMDVIDWAGLSSADPEITFVDEDSEDEYEDEDGIMNSTEETKCLTELNDSETTFFDIARLIEENL